MGIRQISFPLLPQETKAAHIIPTRSLPNLFSKTDKDRIFSSSQDKFQRKLSIFSSVQSLCSHIPTMLSKEEGLFDVP